MNPWRIAIWKSERVSCTIVVRCSSIIVFQDLMRERFMAVIEHATGRKPIGFMSGNQQDPDLMCEVFILESNGHDREPNIASRGFTG